MALKGNPTVYDSRKQKHYKVHPDMAKDPAWMAAHGLIVQDEPRPMEVANLTEAIAETTTTKTKAVKNAN